MDRIVRVTDNPLTLERINAVRLYMRVSRLSDIVNKEGNQIGKWALFGQQRKGTELDWTPRRKPLLENIKLWREVLYRAVGAKEGSQR